MIINKRMHYSQIVYFNYSKALHHQLEGDSSLPEEGWLALPVLAGLLLSWNLAEL